MKDLRRTFDFEQAIFFKQAFKLRFFYAIVLVSSFEQQSIK